MIYAIYLKGVLLFTKECEYNIFCDYARKEIVNHMDKIEKPENFYITNFNKILNKKRKSYKGLEFKEFNTNAPNYIITANKKQNARYNESTYNYFYVFDTETTNIKNKYSVCYLYGIRKYNYNINFNDDTLEQYAEEYKAFTSDLDFYNYLHSINEQAKNDDKLIYIYVHNLVYDLYELLQNIFNKFDITMHDTATTIEKSIFRGSVSKPLIFRFKQLVFVDSLALVNKSLKKVSEKHKIKKLIELKTYKEQYFFGSTLPQTEYDYNKNDLDLTALAIVDAIKSLKTPIYHFNDFVKTRVNTVTGISKYLNKHIYNDERDIKNMKIHTKSASENLPIDVNNNVDKERMLLYQRVFQGGYTHANPLVSYRVLNCKVKSFDKKSHYPATMLMRIFPNKFISVNEDNYNEFVQNNNYLLKSFKIDNLTQLVKVMDMLNCDLSQISDSDDFINNNLNTESNFDEFYKRDYITYFKPTVFDFLGKITLKNVHIKVFNNNSLMPLIAMSKSTLNPIDVLKTNKYIVDNGKILSAEQITIFCTSLDLLSYHLFYDFNIVKVEKLEIATHKSFLDKYINDTLRYHLVNKDEISKIIKGKINLEEAKDYTGSTIFNSETVKNYYEMNKKSQKQFIDSEYTATKTNGVNNQYGINVQKIINDNIIFDFSQYEFIKHTDIIQGCKGTQTTRDFISGLYITAYARYDLALMTYIFFTKSKLQVVYWDTDSIKVACNNLTDIKKANELISFYNNKFKAIQDDIENQKGKLFNLGIFENDFNYDNFITLGAKKYLVQIDKELEITNAGINKKKFGEFLTTKFKEYDYNFEKVVNNCYHPNLLIGSDLTGRKTIKYPKLLQDKIELTVEDESGKEIQLNQYPCALIIDSNYKLSFTDKMNVFNKMHLDLCKRLQLEMYGNFDINCNYEEIGTITENSTDNNDDWLIEKN